MCLFVMSIYPLSNEIKVRHDLLLRQVIDESGEKVLLYLADGGLKWTVIYLELCYLNGEFKNMACWYSTLNKERKYVCYTK